MVPVTNKGPGPLNFKTGQLVYMGGIDDNPGKDEDDIPISKNYVIAALNEMKAGKPVTDPTFLTRTTICPIRGLYKYGTATILQLYSS